MQEFLTAGDVAQVVGRSPVTVIQAADRGRIQIAAKTPNGLRLFLRAEVERFGRTLKTRTPQTETPQTTAQTRAWGAAMARQPSPKNPDRWRALARSAVGMRRVERAIRRMEELEAQRDQQLPLSADDAHEQQRVLLALARSTLLSGRPDEARLLLERALGRRFDAEISALLDLAISLVEVGS
ncbi:MAG TPA: hypothetical protein VJU18_04190 [Vicinamibacteria bacterium]|nr:hypothetical protein [Vicinamibacteria bacterium]